MVVTCCQAVTLTSSTETISGGAEPTTINILGFQLDESDLIAGLGTGRLNLEADIFSQSKSDQNRVMTQGFVFDDENKQHTLDIAIEFDAPEVVLDKRLLGWIHEITQVDTVSVCHKLETSIEALLRANSIITRQTLALSAKVNSIQSEAQQIRRRLTETETPGFDVILKNIPGEPVQGFSDCSPNQKREKSCPDDETCFSYNFVLGANISKSVTLFCVDVPFECNGLSVDETSACIKEPLVCGYHRDLHQNNVENPCLTLQCSGNQICVSTFDGDTSLAEASCQESQSFGGTGTGSFIDPKRCADQLAASVIMGAAVERIKSIKPLIAQSVQTLTAQLSKAQTLRDESAKTLIDAKNNSDESIESLQVLQIQIMGYNESARQLIQQLEATVDQTDAVQQQNEALNTEFNTQLNDVFDTERARRLNTNVNGSFLLYLDILDDLKALLRLQTTAVQQNALEVDHLVKAARSTLRRVKDIQLDTTERRRAVALMEARRKNLLTKNLLMFADGMTSPLGFIPRRREASVDESSFWYRATFATQFAMPTPLDQPEDDDLIAYMLLDPDFQWLRAESPQLQLDVAKRYASNVAVLHLNQPALWLTIDTFELYIDTDYLFAEQDLWFTFKDIMQLHGPAGCQVLGENQAISGLEPCNGWILHKKHRCQLQKGVWEPSNNKSAFLDFGGDATADLCPPTDKKDTLFYNFDFQLFSESKAVPEQNINNLAVSRIPQTELITSFRDLNTNLKVVCETLAAPGSQKYINTNIWSLENNVEFNLGPWTVASSSAQDESSRLAPAGVCSTHWDQIEIESQAQGITIPYLFYKTAQFASQFIFQTNTTQWEVYQYGNLPVDLDISPVPNFLKFNPSTRRPNLEKYITASEGRNLTTVQPGVETNPPPIPESCVMYSTAYTSRHMIPEWFLRVADIRQNVRVSAKDRETGVLVWEEAFQIRGEEIASVGQALPQSQIVAGHLSCITEDCFTDSDFPNPTNASTFVYDFAQGDLCGHPDPTLRRFCGDYIMLFLEKEVPDSDQGDNFTEPNTNPRIDQTQTAALALECDIDTDTDCPVVSYQQNKQVSPVEGVLRWRRQNRLTEMNPKYQGLSAHKVRVALEPFYSQERFPDFSPTQVSALANDRAERRCNEEGLHAMGRTGFRGGLCQLLENYKLLVRGSRFEFDMQGSISVQKRKWVLPFEIRIPGGNISRATDTSAPLCPQLSQISVQPGAGEDTSSQDFWFTVQNVVDADRLFAVTILVVSEQLTQNFSIQNVSVEALETVFLDDLGTNPELQWTPSFLDCSPTNLQPREILNGSTEPSQSNFSNLPGARKVGMRFVFKTGPFEQQRIKIPTSCPWLLVQLGVVTNTTNAPVVSVCLEMPLNLPVLFLTKSATLTQRSLFLEEIEQVSQVDDDAQQILETLRDQFVIGALTLWGLRKAQVEAGQQLLVSNAALIAADGGIPSTESKAQLARNWNKFLGESDRIKQAVLFNAVDNQNTIDNLANQLNSTRKILEDKVNDLYQQLSDIDNINTNLELAINNFTQLAQSEEFTIDLDRLRSAKEKADNLAQIVINIVANAGPFDEAFSSYASSRDPVTQTVLEYKVVPPEKWNLLEEVFSSLLTIAKELVEAACHKLKECLKDGLVSAIRDCVFGSDEICYIVNSTFTGTFSVFDFECVGLFGEDFGSCQVICDVVNMIVLFVAILIAGVLVFAAVAIIKCLTGCCGLCCKSK